MTLIELLLAILLLNVVILTGISMEMGVRRIFTSTDIEAQLLAEAASLMTAVTKDINQGIGATEITSLNPFQGGAPLYRIWVDSNPPPLGNSKIDPLDRQVAYSLTGSHQLLRYNDYAHASAYEVLSSRVTAFSITNPSGLVCASTVTLSLRKDATSPADPVTNPEITIKTDVQYRSASCH